MTAPRLGEKILDLAAGTGGFLTAAIDFIRDKEVRTLGEEAILQKSITGCITGDGYKERIHEKLLTDCNLHTIVRLPQSTFFPATVAANLLFFQKGSPTKEIWYWEHRLPEGQKSYSKTKAIQFDEFAPLIAWWNKREESDVAWRVKVEDLKKGFDLDVKNPNSTIRQIGCVVSAEAKYAQSLQAVTRHCQELAAALEPVGSKMGLIAKNPSSLFLNPKELGLLRSHIQPEGHGIAAWLNGHGITGVVLEYRLPAGRHQVPLLDAHPQAKRSGVRSSIVCKERFFPTSRPAK